MKRVYLGKKELTTIATVTNGGGGGDDTQKWVDYFNGTLTEFTVPEGVTKIKDYAFNECSSLTGITIPSGVTSIGHGAFQSCSSITGITIPDSVISINNGAFWGCSALASVTIENSTSKLAYNNSAFGYISSSAKLYVPSNLLADYQADSNWTGAFGGGIYAIQ